MINIELFPTKAEVREATPCYPSFLKGTHLHLQEDSDPTEQKGKEKVDSRCTTLSNQCNS